MSENEEDSFESRPGDVFDDEYTFRIIEKGSQKEKDLLIHNGQSYTIKKRGKTSTIWICSVRNKKRTCPASIIQKNDKFMLGKNKHIHKKKVNIEKRIEIKVNAKKTSKVQTKLSGRRIAEDAILPFNNMENITDVENCKQIINYQRRKFRPIEPEGINFIINFSAIPSYFLKKDIFKKGERIIIFAIEHQLELLSTAKIFYVDGTFKCVKNPFKQLFTIHSFIKKNEEIKRIPLLYAFMSSGKRKMAINFFLRQ